MGVRCLQRSILASLLVLVGLVGTIVLPSGAAATPVCPTFAAFQSEIENATTDLTVDLSATPNCTLDATSLIRVSHSVNITIKGGGLTLEGGTKDSPGNFNMFHINYDVSVNLSIDQTTLEYANKAIDFPGAGNILLSNSTITGNADSGIAGYIVGVSVVKSSIDHNGGYGIVTAGGNIDINSSSIVNNRKYGVSGEEAVSIENSTISENSITGVSSDGLVTAQNSLFYANGSDGIHSQSRVDTAFVTVAQNGGYGINLDTNVPAAIVATILSQNTGGNCYSTGAFADDGYNLSTDESCPLNNTGSTQVTVDDLALGTLGNYGGTTDTIPIDQTSAAFDAIPVDSNNHCLDANGNAIEDSNMNPITIDQRGTTRPQNGKCDIGAFELSVVATSTNASNASGTNQDTAITLDAQVDLQGSESHVTRGSVLFAISGTGGSTQLSGAYNDAGHFDANLDETSAKLPAGSYTITATYSDSATGVTSIFGGSSDTATLTIASVSTKTTANPASANDTDSSVTLSASVEANTTPVSSGTVTFAVTDAQNTPVGTAVSGLMQPDGTASALFDLAAAHLAPGPYTITASYTDASDIYAGSSNTATLTINPTPAAKILLAPGNTSSDVGQNLTETATVTDEGGFTVPNGTTVTWSLSGINNVPSSTSDTSDGQATFTYSSAFVGNDTLTASISGTPATASAAIDWTTAVTSGQETLMIVSPGAPFISAVLLANGSNATPSGPLLINAPGVEFWSIHATRLVVNGPEAELFGMGSLYDGTSVSWQLDVNSQSQTARLRVNTGYDSGTIHVFAFVLDLP